MSNFANSNASLMSSDDSDFDNFGMNGMNMIGTDDNGGLLSADSFNNVGLIQNNVSALESDDRDVMDYNNAGLISANDAMQQASMVKPASNSSTSNSNANSIRGKLNSIQQKSDNLVSGGTGVKIPQGMEPEVSKGASKLSSAVATGVANAGGTSSKPAQSKPATKFANNSSKKIIDIKDIKEVRLNRSVQELSDAYVSAFKKTFDIDLIPSIVYENMMNLLHVDVNDKPKYYMCNTYRLSSIINLMEYFVPWIYSTFIFGESSAQNLQIYKDVIKQETEMHAQSNTSELINVYKKRYIDRITDEIYVDCVMITPGASKMADEMIAKLVDTFKNQVTTSASKLNGVYKINVSKLSDDAISNAKYVHSNFWYLLQIYEFNIADKRASMTKTAIKAKEALKF